MGKQSPRPDVGNENNLLVLNIKLGSDVSVDPYLEIHLEYWRHDYWKSDRSESIRSFSIPAAKFNLQNKISRGASRGSGAFEVPFSFGHDLKDAIAARFGESKASTPLWLRFENSSGYLPLIPWEHDLQPTLQCPMLRFRDLFVTTTTQELPKTNIVICCSVPIAKSPFPASNLVAKTIDGFREALSSEVLFHVFVDSRESAFFDQQFQAEDVTVYTPEASDTFVEPEKRKSVRAPSRLENPWLQWINDTMEEKTVDNICFVSHGYFNQEHGAVALAQTPLLNEDQYWARFVGAHEISILMNQIGATNAFFLSPESNFSKFGLRSAAHELAQLRSGNVMYFDFGRDSAAEQLADCIRPITSVSDRPEYAKSPAYIAYTNPFRQPQEGVGLESYPQRAHSQLQNRPIVKVRSQTDSSLTPASVINTERFLEHRRIQQSKASMSMEQEVSKETILEIQNILRKYSEQDPSGGTS